MPFLYVLIVKILSLVEEIKNIYLSIYCIQTEDNGSAGGAKIQVRCENTGKFTVDKYKTFLPVNHVINVRHFYPLLLYLFSIQSSRT